ncbi:MAG: nonstructural protein [Microviridae sp.]|nr:MAG: nonstructural protein [Microviridae sp.]
MIRKVYTIFDSAARIYLPPFHLHADGEAVRAFRDAANSPSHYVGQHPADYTLMRIGSYDDSTGMYIMLEGFENLGNALEYVEAKKPDAQLNLEIN